jgi:hypothetical protein
MSLIQEEELASKKVQFVSQPELNLNYKGKQLQPDATVKKYLTVRQEGTRNVITMQDWTQRLHQFLTMTGRELLTHAGTVSHEEALHKAHAEYEKFRLKQLKEPAEVEKHFIEAEKELKRIEEPNKDSAE